MKWEWYDDANTMRMFIHLLLKATHTAARYRGYDLQPGDVVYGHEAFSNQLNTSIQSNRTSLNKLKSTGEVTIKTTNKFSIVSITKWSEYQTDQQADQQATNRPLTGEQQATNSIQECKKVKKVKKDTHQKEFDEFWLSYPRKIGKEPARKAYLKALKSTDHQTIMDGLESYKKNKPEYADWAHASTWLNAARWNDEYDEKKKSELW